MPLPARRQLPHEEFLWDGGWHWGEWCEPVVDAVEPLVPADQGHVATAYLHHTASIAAQIGRLLGHSDDATAFDDLAARTLDAWRREYLADDGSLTPDTQANHVRALAFGLVPDELRGRPAPNGSCELIRDAGTHLGTGFLATPILLPVLADHGHLDVAYEVLLQDTPPSWLTMVDRGATTVWEEWEGIDERRRRPRVAQPLQQGCGDLVPAPLRRRHPTRPTTTSPTADSESNHSRAAGSLGLKRCTTRRTGASSRRGASTQTSSHPRSS